MKAYNARLFFFIVCTLVFIQAGCSHLVEDYRSLLNEGCAFSEAPQVSSVGPLYTSNGINWNSYVRADSSSRISATGTACTGTETGGYNACIHAGEMRLVTVSNRTSCSGLSIKDDLNAFNWLCDDSSGSARFISGGLAKEKYLSDLVDFSAGTWRSNSVTVTDCGGSSSTSPAAWWQNPVIKDPAGPSPVSLAAGTVYLVTTNANLRYSVNGNGTAFVVQPGITLVGAADEEVVSIPGHDFAWVEGTFNTNVADDAVAFDSTTAYSVIRNLKTFGSDLQGCCDYSSIGLGLSKNNLFSYMKIHGSRVSFNSSFSYYYYVGSFNGSILMENAGKENNTIINAVSTSGDYLFNTGNSSGHDFNILMNYTAINGSNNCHRGNTMHDSSFINSLLLNCPVAYDHSSSRTTVINLLAAGSGDSLSAYGDYNYYSGFIGWGLASCNISGTLPGIDSSCLAQNISDHTTRANLDLSATIIGKVTSETSNSHGSGIEMFDNITDKVNFENFFRGWGRQDNNAFPHANQRGSCSSGDNCQIWDLSLRSSDSNAREVLSLPTGNDFFYHRWNVSTQADCQAIAGATWQGQVCSLPGYLDQASCEVNGTWSTNICSSLVLRHAYERFNDGLGNENGLCESNETCIYTPNIGAYQGHGPFISAGSFSGGRITGVTLLRHQYNGR